mgnify:CR=1 FL=1
MSEKAQTVGYAAAGGVIALAVFLMLRKTPADTEEEALLDARKPSINHIFQAGDTGDVNIAGNDSADFVQRLMDALGSGVKYSMNSANMFPLFGYAAGGDTIVIRNEQGAAAAPSRPPYQPVASPPPDVLIVKSAPKVFNPAALRAYGLDQYYPAEIQALIDTVLGKPHVGGNWRPGDPIWNLATRKWDSFQTVSGQVTNMLLAASHGRIKLYLNSLE